jgi:hypothetical protein
VTTPYIASASYQPFGPESSLAYGGGSLTRNATFDQRYRLTSFNVLNGATPLADYRYGIDAAGNITAIADNLDARYSRSFGYDDLYRLTAANTGINFVGHWQLQLRRRRQSSRGRARTEGFQLHIRQRHE